MQINKTELKNFLSGSVYARLVTAILLFIALFTLPIGYYNFLRWVVCLTAIYTLIISYKADGAVNFGVWLFILIAILFNPIFPIFMSRSIWRVSDLIVAVIFLASTFFIRENGI